MTNYRLSDVNLRLFDGAAAAGTAGGEGSAGETAGEETEGRLPKAGNENRRGSGRRSKSGGLQNVLYGRQNGGEAAAQKEENKSSGAADNPGSEKAAAAAQSHLQGQDENPGAGGDKGSGSPKSGVQTTSDALEARRAEFEKLIEGEYKDLYTEKFQTAFNRRFKEMKGMEEALNSQKPILDMLMQRYKIKNGDMGKLQKALEEDDAYWEETAAEEGLTVEQYRAMQKLERENAELKKIRQRQLGEQQAQQQVSDWYRQAKQVKELYPGFDLKAEAANRDFLGLLKSGLPVQKAYELIHMEEIKEAAARSAAQAAGEQVVAKIKAKAARPAENGTSAQSGVIVKSSVSDLSKSDRAEIARRVQRGEIIKF